MRGICSPSLFSRKFRRSAVLLEAIFVSPERSKAWRAHGPFLCPWPRLYWWGEKIIVVHIQWRNASKSAGSVARIEGAKGSCRREGMNTVTCGAACGGGRPHTSPDTWECIGFAWPSGRNTVPLPSFLFSFFPFFWYRICSQMCGLLSCEPAGGIKAPFIQSPLRRDAEKASFTEPCRLTPTHPNLSVTANLGLTGSLWESRCLSLMPLRCGL